jgi:hypothetical protein
MRTHASAQFGLAMSGGATSIEGHRATSPDVSFTALAVEAH